MPPRVRTKLYPLLRDHSVGVLPFPLPEFPGNAWFVGFDKDWRPRLYGWRGPRLISLFRQLIIGSPAPGIRDSLRAALWELQLPTRGMPLQAREWLLISLPVAFFLFMAGLLLRFSSIW